jgi:hypothetical protein
MKKILNPFSSYWSKPQLCAIMISAVCLLFSCKKFVEIGAPISKIETASVFSNDQAAFSAALGVYANMGTSGLTICSGGATLYPALSADELTYTSTNTELLSYQHNAIIADNGTGIYGRLWSPAYKNIYYANAVLEGVSKSVSISDTLKKQLKGEMLVVRALNYFYLVNLFGDVPLELSTDYKVNNIMVRTPVNKIYDQLVTDLTLAVSLLPASNPAQLNIRPNKWAASALLARVYLYQKDWANAESQASAVIGSAQYHLENNLNNVFAQGSAETIWQLASDYRNTSEGSTFIPSGSSSRPSYAINNYLLSAFENGDQRKVSWLKKNTVGGTDYYYPYKYKVRTSTPITEYYVIFRLAEQYLIRAETRAQLNNLDGAKADLNQIRLRAGLTETNAADQPSLLSAVAAERQTELFCEWGHRFLDLKRNGQVDQLLGIRKAPDWQPTDAVYPIPLSQIQANPYLVQNSGY